MVYPERASRRIIAKGIRAVFLQYRNRVDHVPYRGVHRGAVGRHYEPVDHHFLPGYAFCDLLRAQYGIECPRPYDVVGLWPQRHREKLPEHLIVPVPVCVIEC